MKRFLEALMYCVDFINDNSEKIEEALKKLISLIGWVGFTGLAIKGLFDMFA